MNVVKSLWLRLVISYTIASYLFSAMLSMFAILSKDVPTWRGAFGIPNALAPVAAPVLLWATLQPLSSRSISNFEVMERAAIWAILAGLICIVYSLMSRRLLGRLRLLKYGLVAVFVVTLLVAFKAGMCLQEGWMRERDYYPQIAPGGYVDRSGNLIIKGPFTNHGVFSDGLAAVSVGGKYGFINLKGEMVIPPQYEEASGFDEGLGRVKVGGRVGFIDRQGTMVIEPKFEDASGFSEGMAAVTSGGKRGYIDRTGRFVISPQFVDARNFSEGMAAATLDDLNWGYIDRDGAFVVPPFPCSMPQEFHWGSARVRCGGEFRRIDWQGHFVD